MTTNRHLLPLSALRAFAAAARHLSFKRAAEELRVTPTAISHHVRLLEDTLGQPLFVRHVRGVALTSGGATLFPVLRQSFDAVDDVWSSLRRGQTRTRVVLSATRLMTARCLVPKLEAFTRAHPDIDLYLHSSDHLVDLAAGAADLAIRYGDAHPRDATAEPLLDEQIGVLCSPMLRIERPEDLRGATLLHAEWVAPTNKVDWASWSVLAGLSGLPLHSGPCFTDDAHALDAAIAGQGVVLSSLALAASAIAGRALVHPFGPLIRDRRYYLVTAPAARTKSGVKQVRDWLLDILPGPRAPERA